MKIIYYFSLFICLQNFIALGWDAIIVPLSFDKKSNQWDALVGKNADGTWSFFSKPGQGKDKAYMFAASALKDQTNGAYIIEPVKVELAPYIRLSNHDMVYFVPVNYIDAPFIYQKVKESGENYIKKDYAWLPVQEIINNKIIKKTDQDQQIAYTFSSGIQKILADYWENILIEMEKKGSAFAQKTAQSDTSWRTIPNSPLSHSVKKQTQNYRKNNNLKNSD